MMVRYSLAEGWDAHLLNARDALLQDVARLREQGFLPLGGVAVVFGDDKYYFCQAMILPKEEPDPVQAQLSSNYLQAWIDQTASKEEPLT